jgi:two-component system, NtrC family, sensor kinase
LKGNRARRPSRKSKAKKPTRPPKRARRGSAAGKGETTVAQFRRELQEAAEQQQATSDILQLISNSPSDPQPVFETILACAVQACGADNGAINRWDGKALHLIAAHNMPPAFVELRERTPYSPHQRSASGRLLATGKIIHIADLAADQSYAERNPPTVAAVEIAGVRTTLAVPMMKGSELVGSFTVGRNQVRPFSDKQIEFVQSFASNAVIAIENARLLHELQETLQQQTAAGDILKIISRSTFNLQEVLDTLVELVSRLCDADLAAMHRPQGTNQRAVAIYGGPSSHRQLAGTVPFEPGRGSVIARTVLERKPVHVADVLVEPDYQLQDAQQRLGYRTVLGVPLLREGNPIGVIVLMRMAVRPFTERQIKLVQNFADQAVIAIENTRLLNELHRRTDELGRSVAELQRERNNKLMNLEAMVASIAHEVRQPLAGIATNGGAALQFLGHEPSNIEEARLALADIVRDSHRASQVFDNIRALFGKADQGHEPLNMNALILGVLQTLRDELRDHGVETRVALQSELPFVVGHKGQLQEIFINLIRNAIEAMGDLKDDQRTLQVTTKHDGNNALVATVEDSGPGVDPKQLENIFDAFVTTKQHGMGLGLAISRMIIERHAGHLSAAPAYPRGCIFRLVLPAGQIDLTEKTVP